ncbi:MAG: UTP--glucose-1-phosphate uridylyltransferase GalU [Sphingomonadales bacterium]|nr:UTP--glucose-1-phosphate uridylyltransferase GalU [Sphingomonadales bacterium]
MKIKKAILPVAGMGTRFLPATKAMPKEMLPIIDTPLIQYAVEEAFAAGIEDVILITGRGKSAIENHFDRAFEVESVLRKQNKQDMLDRITEITPKNGRIISLRQGEPLGLGHAIGCAQSIIGNEPFAVLLADDIFAGTTPVLNQMIDVYNEKGGNVVSVMDVPIEHTSRYGIITPGKSQDNLVEIKGLVEKPEPKQAPSTLAISGRYILQPEIFKYLAKGKKGAGGEIQLTDAMEQMMGESAFNGLVYDGQRYDCGNIVGWLEANIATALRRDDLREEVERLLIKFNSIIK